MDGHNKTFSGRPPMSLRNRLLSRLRDRLGGDAPPLRIAFWDGEAFDFTAVPTVTLALGSPRLRRWLATGNIAGLAEAYVAGELVVKGRVEDVVKVGVTLAGRLGAIPLLSRAAPLLTRLPRRHSKARDARAVRYQYDVSNDFYRL